MSARDVIANHRIGYPKTPDGLLLGSVHADAILAALETAGYAVVPKEPTLGMNEAGYMAKYAGFWAPDIYKAMVQAAKETP